MVTTAMEAGDGRLYLQPLGEGEARILRFHGFKNGIPYCRIQVTHHDTTERPTVNLTYHAMSYVWGDTDDPSNFRPIICNGVKVHVPRNLHAAMVEIWRDQPLLKLWADAVCIDQHDAEEKSRQVALMYRIFRDAACVQVWLGQDDPRTVDTLEYLVLLNRQRFRAAHSIQIPAFQQFDHLLAHPWLSRAWTMQEVSLARRALFRVGSYTADRDAIHEAMSHYTSVFVDHERGLEVACGLGYSQLRGNQLVPADYDGDMAARRSRPSRQSLCHSWHV